MSEPCLYPGCGNDAFHQHPAPAFPVAQPDDDVVELGTNPIRTRYELWDGEILVIEAHDSDPGDMGEPRSVYADGVTYLSVRSARPCRYPECGAGCPCVPPDER